MKVTSAEFHSSAADYSSCPITSLPEFAFIGRSNVGKSTLINRIACRKDLARVSSTPGFTKTINFFNINRSRILVDLPGYGFAKASQLDRSRFAGMIEEYILQRESLACVFVLVDCSIPPQPTDLDFVQWVSNASLPVAIVFTKADKANESKVLEHTRLFTRTISDWFEDPPRSFTSSMKATTGIQQIQGFILGGAFETFPR